MEFALWGSSLFFFRLMKDIEELFSSFYENFEAFMVTIII